jgi:hypothetical protein
MESPYRFSATNPRFVSNTRNTDAKVYGATALLYGYSLLAYNRRFLRVDGNAVAAVGFAVASLPAAYAYSRFFFSSAENEAALMNNSQEE